MSPFFTYQLTNKTMTNEKRMEFENELLDTLRQADEIPNTDLQGWAMAFIARIERESKV